MPLKDCLVHIDTYQQSRARLEAAAALAVRHSAHLTGVCVITPPEIPGYLRAEISDEVFKRHAEHARAQAKQAETAFNECARRAGVTSEWRCVEGAALAALCLHGRYADIVIAGQRDPTGSEGADDPAIPDQLVLAVGRPVLVIPAVGTYPVIGERVMVAWDASRLAARAINDALPLLAMARHVIVVAVNPEGGPGGHGEIPCADICLHLARHGVKAEAQHLYADDIDAGDMLLSRAADAAIDLLVMGAYGHARWREVVLGGVTQHMLRHMTVPVLMSH